MKDIPQFHTACIRVPACILLPHTVNLRAIANLIQENCVVFDVLQTSALFGFGTHGMNQIMSVDFILILLHQNRNIIIIPSTGVAYISAENGFDFLGQNGVEVVRHDGDGLLFKHQLIGVLNFPGDDDVANSQVNLQVSPDGVQADIHRHTEIVILSIFVDGLDAENTLVKFMTAPPYTGTWCPGC